MKKHFLCAVILCLVFTFNGLAQDDAPATKEDVEKYLQVMHSHDMMQNMLDAMSKPMQQMIHDRYLKDKDKLPPDFESRMNKMTSDMLKGVPFDQMMDAMVPTYQKHFTRGDINALLVFYSSPVGQKLLRELPAITAESMQSMLPILRQHMDEVNQRIQQDVADMIKETQTKAAQDGIATPK
jgi:uncharacterized protein